VAARRLVSRQALALAGGYSGARRDRASMAGWRTSSGSPETDVIADLPTLRARCADLERNAPVAASIVGTHVTHVVGTGLALTPAINAQVLRLSADAQAAWQRDTRARFDAWASSADASLDRVLSFYGLQEVALRSTLTRGDAFVLTPMVVRGPQRQRRLALQLIEGDRVCNPSGTANTETLTEGIEHSAETGEAIAAHVCSHHPGDLSRATRTWERRTYRGDSSGRRNVLHLFRQLRPGLRRGVPILAPVIEPIKQLTRYSQAELDAAVVSALFAVFLKMDPQAFQELFDDEGAKTYLNKASDWSGELEGGKVINLVPGEEPVNHNPGRPNAQFDPFTQSCFRQIGMAVGLPYEVLVMHFQSSYSAARGALLLAWKHFMGWRNWLATTLCQPVYEVWLAEEVSAGRIQAAGFFADELVRAAWCGAQWVGDGPGSIDPEKEARAARERVALGTSTLAAESLLHDGVDWETKHAQLRKEAEARRAAGLEMPGDAQQPAAPSAAAAPADDEDPNAADPADDDTPAASPRPDPRRAPPITRPAPAPARGRP
jgi:lambda family phage portal protein